MDMMVEFVNLGHQVIAVGQETETVWKQKFAECGIDYQQLPVDRNGMNPLRDLKSIAELDRFMKREKPDCLFIYQMKTVIYGCIMAKKNKIENVYPLIAGLGSIFRGVSLKSKILRQILMIEYKIALKNSKSIMFQNQDDLFVFVNRNIIKKDKAFIINGSGVNIKKFTVTPLPKQVTFLMITRLIKDKGIIEYLEACKSIKKKYSNLRCLLVGPYDTNPSALKPMELDEYIKDGVIEYFGEQEDVRPFLHQSSVFILPSYHEGTPKTVLEAMASGRAVITTNAPGCKETVVDGVNGFLVPVKNVEIIIEKMRYFITNPDVIKQMGLAGRKIAEEKYDVKKVNAAIMQIMGIY